MNCKNMCCNQFGERDDIQAYIDKLERENEQFKQTIKNIKDGLEQVKSSLSGVRWEEL